MLRLPECAQVHENMGLCGRRYGQPMSHARFNKFSLDSSDLAPGGMQSSRCPCLLYESVGRSRYQIKPMGK